MASYITAPAHSIATKVVVYPALLSIFFFAHSSQISKAGDCDNEVVVACLASLKGMPVDG